MNLEEVFDYLKNSLTVEVNTWEDCGLEGNRLTTNVEIYLEHPVTKEKVLISSHSSTS